MQIAKMEPLAALQKYFGFNSFKGEQKAVIENLLNGNHTFVIMPTGGGKSLVFQISALAGVGITFVIMPILSLIND